MTGEMDRAIAALGRGDIAAASSWARAAPTPSLGDLVARDAAAARDELVEGLKKRPDIVMLLLLGRADPSAARARYDELRTTLAPLVWPAAALMWSPEDAAKLVLECGQNRWPHHITAQNAFNTWAGVAWTPWPLERLRDLVKIGGDEILTRHVGAHLWRGHDLAPDDIAGALAWSKRAAWCLDWIRVEGYRAPERVRALLTAAPERHAAVLRGAAGAWLDEIPADAEVTLRRALRSGGPWEPQAAPDDLVAAFLHQRWRKDPESCRRALPFLAGHDRVHYLADFIALESIAPEAADEVVGAIKDLLVMWITEQSLVPRLSDARWSRIVGKLTPFAAQQYIRRLCITGDHAGPRARQLASIAVLDFTARGRSLSAIACVDPPAARAMLKTLSDEERDQMDAYVDNGERRGADMLAHVRLIEAAVGRDVNPRYLYALLLAFPDMPDRLRIRAFDAMAKADPAELRAASPFFSLAFERVDDIGGFKYLLNQVRT